MLRKPLSAEVPRTLRRDFRYFYILAIAEVLVSFAMACTRTSPSLLPSRVVPDRQVQEEDIRESVFRYQIAHWYSNEEAHAFFLSMDGKDPPQAFVQRFAGHIPQVKESSRSYFRKSPFPGWLRDKESGLKAALLSVGAISWLSPNLVEVEGGIYCGGLCGASGSYHLERQSGKWVVKNFEVRAIS